MLASAEHAEILKPYVPRLTVEWLRETPEARYRAIDGTLAFVDISGFTQLTERLARRGKVGAEEVSDTLQDVFTQLLDVAYDYGAGLLKWGGDALLLLFDGPDHARRACRACGGMQETLGRIGRLRTSGGQVTLRMSVGVHTGQFDFFLVGGSHRELVITGPAATATVDLESSADAGEILVSPAAAACLDAGDLGEPKDGGVLLARAPATFEAHAPDVGDVSAIDLPGCVPTALRRQLLVEQGEAEHRTVTVAFLQFSGLDGLLARDGPGVVTDRLEGMLTRVQAACDRYGVTFFATDVNRDGGKVILASGAPVSSGDDEERMLRAVRAIADDPGEIPLRVGVNTGRAFTCDFGPPYRRTYQIYGDAVNLAARVMAKASPGQTLVTDATLGRAATAYELERLEPFTVKGKSEPVVASVLGRATGARGAAAPDAPLVGRAAELAALAAAAGAARRGAGRVVELAGEAGVGKTRLVDELLRREPELEPFRTACEQYESSTPYFPFRSLLHDLLGIPRESDPDEAEARLRARVERAAPQLLPLLPLVAAPLGLELPPTRQTALIEDRFIPDRTAEAVDELLEAVRTGPTLLVVESAQWADDASAGLLARLAERAGDRPWLILASRRDGDSGFSASDGVHTERLRLDPLGAADAFELAAALTDDDPLPPHTLRALAERSGGNPLFLAELVGAARAGASLAELPDTVEALMAAQIDRLEPRARTVLRYAAVLGIAFETDLLLDALRAELPAPGDRLWRSLADYLVQDEPGTLRFRHALARDAAYEGLPYRRRRALHERVGATIERLAGDRAADEAELLSLHFFEAHDFARAWTYARAAGERARAVYANAEAATLYARALAAARRLRRVGGVELAETAEALGDVAVRLSEHERARAAYRLARRRVRADRVAHARLLFKEAMVPYRQGRFPLALRWLHRGLAELDGADAAGAGAQRARLLAWCATVRQHQRRPHEAIALCERAIPEAEDAAAADALAQAYYTLDWAYLALGRSEDAVYSPLAIPIYEELGDLDRLSSVLNNLGGRAYMEGRWNDAVDLAERARRALDQIGDAAGAALCATNLAEVQLDQGRLDEAAAALRSALRVRRSAGNPEDVAITAGLLGLEAARAGRFEESDRLLAEAAWLLGKQGDDPGVLTCAARRVESLVLRGDGEAALAEAAAALERAASLDGVGLVVAGLHRLRGWAHLQAGRLEEARAALDTSLATLAIDPGGLIQSADLERAHTLNALVRLGERAGQPVEELVAERDRIVETLGVTLLVEPPLG